MNMDDVLQVELLKLRVAVGRVRGWHASSVHLLTQHHDPLDAYRAARINERTIRAWPRNDPMLATEIARDRVLISYTIALGNILFALLIVTMVVIIV